MILYKTDVNLRDIRPLFLLTLMWDMRPYLYLVGNELLLCLLLTYWVRWQSVQKISDWFRKSMKKCCSVGAELFSLKALRQYKLLRRHRVLFMLAPLVGFGVISLCAKASGKGICAPLRQEKSLSAPEISLKYNMDSTVDPCRRNTICFLTSPVPLDRLSKFLLPLATSGFQNHSRTIVLKFLILGRNIWWGIIG